MVDKKLKSDGMQKILVLATIAEIQSKVTVLQMICDLQRSTLCIFITASLVVSGPPSSVIAHPRNVV